MHLLRRPALAALLSALVAAGSLAACGGDDEGTAADAPGGNEADGVDQPAPPSEPVEVLALDNSFEPHDITITAGTTVVFRNGGRNDHNVIPENRDDPWRVDTEDLGPGESAERTFTEPGTYAYYCSIHGAIGAGMDGVIVVE